MIKQLKATRAARSEPGDLLARVKKHGGKFASRLFLYILLIAIGFVYLYPILKMISQGLMDPFDSASPLVNWIPTKLTFSNFTRAFAVLGGWKTLFVTIGVMLLIAAAQTISSAVIAYGFSKFDFPCKKLLFLLMIACFMLPSQITMLPNYVLFKDYHMLHTILPLFVPSLLGQGIRQSLFILIFYQFYNMAPKSLDEAAFIDGAGILRTFLTINLRMTTPALVVVFVFSFVWNWNETNLSSSYFGDTITTLPLALENFRTRFEQMYPSNYQGTSINNMESLLSRGIQAAGTLLSIVPLVVLYLFIERKLIESIDRSGITGE